MTTRGAAILAMSAALLAGCAVGGDGSGTMQQQLGLSAPPPDEFLIVARAPLEVPADPAALPLPPPRLGAPSRVEQDSTASARAALAGAGGGVTAAPPSAGEAALLNAAGAADADPRVREQIVADARPTQRRFGLDSFLGFPIVQDPAAAAEVLEPEAEAERLRAIGKPAPVAPPKPDEN